MALRIAALAYEGKIIASPAGYGCPAQSQVSGLVQFRRWSLLKENPFVSAYTILEPGPCVLCQLPLPVSWVWSSYSSFQPHLPRRHWFLPGVSGILGSPGHTYNFQIVHDMRLGIGETELVRQPVIGVGTAQDPPQPDLVKDLMCQHPFLPKFLVCQCAFGDPGSGMDSYIGVTPGIVAAYINLARRRDFFPNRRRKRPGG